MNPGRESLCPRKRGEFGRKVGKCWKAISLSGVAKHGNVGEFLFVRVRAEGFCKLDAKFCKVNAGQGT